MRRAKQTSKTKQNNNKKPKFLENYSVGDLGFELKTRTIKIRRGKKIRRD